MTIEQRNRIKAVVLERTMCKTAGPIDTAVGAVTGTAIDWLNSAVILGSAILMGAAGIGGWAASEITAKGQNDINNVRAEYMDARLSADIAENEQKLRNEFNARRQAQQGKQINLFR